MDWKRYDDAPSDFCDPPVTSTVKWSGIEKTCMQALKDGSANYQESKERNAKRLKGTCQWVLQHPNFQSWLESSTSNILWISADPGCGKSTLSRALVDQDLPGVKECLICYFFFRDDNEVGKRATTALSALLHQLFRQNPRLIKHASQSFVANEGQIPQSFRGLWEILMKAVSDPEAGEVICVLDALDECVEAERYQVINAVTQFYGTSLYREDASKLKICVTSRPYHDIEDHFVALTSKFPKMHIAGELEEAHTISSEISRVVRYKIADLSSEFKLNPSERSTFESKLLGMTHRTYLWTPVIDEVIRKIRTKTEQTPDEAVTNHLPTTVEDAYEAILSRIEQKNRSKARKILHIVVAAVRPLTVEEMNIALALEDHHRSFAGLAPHLEDADRFKNILRDICGLFITLVDNQIFLLHPTAKEFLVAGNGSNTGAWKHSLDALESEAVLTRICTTYLRFADNHGAQDRKESGKTKDSFLQYAAQYWTSHFNKAESRVSDDTLQHILDLCDPNSKRFAAWFAKYWKSIHGQDPHPKFTSRLLVGSYLGHTRLVRLLLSTDSTEVVTMDSEKRTPLIWASMNGHDEVVRLLLKMSEVNVNLTDSEGRGPLLLATANGHKEVVMSLLATGKVRVDSVDYNTQTALTWAASKGYEELAKILIDNAEDSIDLKDSHGQTPLSFAAKRGHEALVRLLMATGKVTIDVKDKRGQTPFLLAAREGHESVVRMLLETGKIDIDVKDTCGGRTPLSWAASYGHEGVVGLLLETGMVDVDLADTCECRTPLLWAAMNGHGGVVRLLLETAKVDVDWMYSYDGRTPLLWAARNGHSDVVRQLLDTGKVDTEWLDSYDNQTPLSAAINAGHESVVELFLQQSR